MGRRIKISADALPKSIRNLEKGLLVATRIGIIRGARDGQRMLKAVTPEDLGNAKDSWGVKSSPGDVTTLHNDAPYVGILESGARPHEVNQEGRDRIMAWAKRKFGADDKAAKAAMFAIVNKIRKVGTKPTYFVKGNLPALAEATQRRVARNLARFGQRFSG